MRIPRVPHPRIMVTACHQIASPFLVMKTRLSTVFQTGEGLVGAFFGVKTNFDPSRSDLDFLVAFDNTAPAVFAQAYFELKEGLKSLFGRPVDLVTESSLANPYFRQRVASESQTANASWLWKRRPLRISLGSSPSAMCSYTGMPALTTASCGA